jgi:valyl-tRNA synthetase
MTASIPNLSSQYDPTNTESKWQQYWEENQIFKADPKKAGETYSVIIPPPNVTGRLHMGHAFNTALIDTLVRYHRMTGKNTLCLPGTDHASIAVQTIIENKLRAEGKTRDDLGREEFLKRTWEWKAESGGQIVSQLRRLGFSVDWSRERFTLDKGCSDAVLEAFTRLHKEGLIYRGRYLVSWCPASQSAVSDLEVESQEVNGKLWYFSYPLAEDSSQSLTVATTRPETMLGDTAVAVNPKDDRYKHLIGKMLRLPLTDRQIPIIGDDHVEMDFGTGCVKVTPSSTSLTKTDPLTKTATNTPDKIASRRGKTSSPTSKSTTTLSRSKTTSTQCPTAIAAKSPSSPCSRPSGLSTSSPWLPMPCRR